MTGHSTRRAATTLVALLLSSCAATGTAVPTSPPSLEVTPLADVRFDALNPARGDASPLAGTLFGDRAGSAATGFLFRPVDGFSSPPHIHNVSYRAIVIRGGVYNGPPDAERVWMPPGSYWTQPLGAVHITAAREAPILAYVEIDEGPYLVRPPDQAFASEERPVNLLPADLPWEQRAGFRVASLWGDAAGRGGQLLELPANGGAIAQSSEDFRVVVIAGLPTLPGGDAGLEPGSYLHARGAALELRCGAEACTVYVRHDGAVDVRTGG
ncbi:MAG: DUF4437 domain-containing protein [Myxococcota bacterium]